MYPKPRYIVFDAFDVLAQAEDIISSYDAVARIYGLNPYEMTLAVLRNPGPPSLAARRFAKRRPTPHEQNELLALDIQARHDGHKVRARPGAAELVSQVARAGYQPCIMTNAASPYVNGFLRALPAFYQWPNYCFWSCATGKTKLQAEAYDHVARMLRVEDEATILRVGNCQADLYTAAMMGWQVMQVARNPQIDPNGLPLSSLLLNLPGCY